MSSVEIISLKVSALFWKVTLSYFRANSKKKKMSELFDWKRRDQVKNSFDLFLSFVTSNQKISELSRMHVRPFYERCSDAGMTDRHWRHPSTKVKSCYVNEDGGTTMVFAFYQVLNGILNNSESCSHCWLKSWADSALQINASLMCGFFCNAGLKSWT